MKYTAGLGKLERERYSALLRGTKATISVAEAAKILNLESNKAAMLLARFGRKGWLKRIVYGVYIPVPLESDTGDIVAEDPFVIAEKLFSPCYIAGMNAANYWELTEQLFRTITVMTQKQIREKTPNIAGSDYVIHSIKPSYFFGLKSVWIGNVKVNISDATRTLVDMAMFPQFCGGIRFLEDILKSYYQSKYKDMDLLIQYLEQAQNGAAIKRLGFLVEKLFTEEEKFTTFCLKNLTKGNIKISPGIECSKLIKRWRIWVPEQLKEESSDRKK